MTPAELEKWLDDNPSIQWYDDEDNNRLFFKNPSLAWYQSGDNCTAVSYNALKAITPDNLLKAINSGLQVEQMTRVTGYFSKVNSWNKGKRAELKDRQKVKGERLGC